MTRIPAACWAAALALAGTARGASLPGDFGLRGSMGIPAGDFALTYGRDAGYARQGWGIAACHALPFGSPSFAWTTDVSWRYAPVDRAALEEALDEGGLGYGEVHGGGWLMVPVHSGLRYRMGEARLVFWEMQAGLAWIKQGALPGRRRTLESEWDASLSFSLGIGILAAGRVEMGLRYLHLGAHELKVEISRGAAPMRGGKHVEASLLALDLGLWI